MNLKVDLRSLSAYAESCREIADKSFPGMSLKAVADAAADYNAYPGLEALSTPRSLAVLEERLNDPLREKARQAILEGLIFWEHTAAGEATRLKLGPKYLIHPHRVYLGHDYLADGLREPAQSRGDDAADWLRYKGRLRQPQDLLPLSLGARHMYQWAFEVSRLAEDYGLDPQAVMARQKTLLVVNEQSRAEICSQILSSGFLGLEPQNFMFMVQPSFWGLTPGDGGWRFDENTARRLHNHGQLAMQKTMERQIFHLDRSGNYHYLSRADFFNLLENAVDLVSYNIEDLGFLTQALDLDTIGMALELGQEGFGMTMEIVANNPEHPIKGGLCAFDPALGRDVVVESFRLRDMPPESLKYLNKNFNHYPRPSLVFKQLHQEGLFMPIDVKDGGLYFQPVQGDLNFLVKTAFISRRCPAPIKSWKSSDDTPAALEAMSRQDAQAGFADFVKAGAHNRTKA